MSTQVGSPASRPRLVILAGPTAAGKTAISLDVAEAVNAEIISADSRQVYRGLDIGTAKATSDERRRVPHHLIDVVDPDQSFDVARFVTLAREAVAAILSAGRLPMVVGGTGLYLRALCGGLTPVAGRDDAVRAQLEEERRQRGDHALHARLAEVDPDAARRIAPADAVRVVRALEVYTLTGRTLSEHQRAHRFADRPYRVLWLVVDREMEALRRRIVLRAQAMFDGGLLDEARALRDRYGELPLLQTFGYREALEVVDGQLDGVAAVEQTALRTRRYAKRQRTWLRREPVDHWLTTPGPDAIISRIREFSAGAVGAGV